MNNRVFEKVGKKMRKEIKNLKEATEYLSNISIKWKVYFKRHRKLKEVIKIVLKEVKND
nr:MAG TPA: hypothetical protein [Caudoviricetes sp.]